MKKLIFGCLFITFLAGCSNNDKIQGDAQGYIDGYTKEYVRLYTESAEAQWSANTKIVPGDSTNAVLVQRTGEAYANFTGTAGNNINNLNYDFSDS